MQINKAEALDLCKGCPNRWKPRYCYYWNVEGAKTETIELPACMSELLTLTKSSVAKEPSSEGSGSEGTTGKVAKAGADHPPAPSDAISLVTHEPTNEKHSVNNESGSVTNETDRKKTKRKDNDRTIRSPHNEKVRSQQYSITPDALDIHILRLITEKYHERGIARQTGRRLSTIQYRLERLEKQGLIKSRLESSALSKIKTFELTQKGTKNLIHHDSAPVHTPFTAHSMSFKFPILSGIQPKSPQGYKMTNWMGYVFDYPNHSIRSTPKNIIVDVNLDLGADSVDNLNLKYSQYAQKFAVEFAERYKLTIGAVQRYREPHFTIEDSALGQLVAERGEFVTRTGVMFNKSQSKGDAEFKEEGARAFEFTLNQMPTIVAGLKSGFSELKATVTEKVSALESNLTLLTLQQRNMELEAQNREMMNQIKTFSAELSNIKALLGNIPAPPEKKPEDKWSRIYG